MFWCGVGSPQVASEAIKQAERDGQHVVLVDTAGRMQVRMHVMLGSLLCVSQVQ